MTYENYVKANLVTFIVKEAFDGGSNDMMLAVAQVIANRVAEGWQGGDWMRVMDSAPMYAGTKREEFPQPDSRSLAFRDLLHKVDDVYHGIADDGNVNIDTEEGKRLSLYYAWGMNINVEWFRENILKESVDHPRLAKVGGMVFFG